jgi:hypothetical protein
VSDRLALSNAIEDAGIARDKAQRLASVIFDAIHSSVATKADLAALEARLTERFTRRGIAALIIATTGLFGALHMWPPHL